MVKEDGAKASCGETLNRYKLWLVENGEDDFRVRSLRTPMTERGIKSLDTREGAFFLNYRFKETFHDFPGRPSQPSGDTSNKINELVTCAPQCDRVSAIQHCLGWAG